MSVITLSPQERAWANSEGGCSMPGPGRIPCARPVVAVMRCAKGTRRFVCQEHARDGS